MRPRTIVDFGIIQIFCVCLFYYLLFLLVVTCFLSLLRIVSFLMDFSFIFFFENRPTPSSRLEVIRYD